MEFANNRIGFFKNSFSTSLVGQNCLVAMMQVCIFATELFLAVMTDYEYIIIQVKKFHFSKWDDGELRKCVDMLPKLSRQELVSLYQSKWLDSKSTFRDAIFNLLFMERIEERDKKIKAMNVDELIKNLHDENGYGKFIVLEMKERYDSLDDEDRVKILDTLSETTKANQKWAESKRKKLDADKTEVCQDKETPIGKEL